MKKVVTIKIEVDSDHPEKDEWLHEKDYFENEIDEAIEIIRGRSSTGRRNYKNCSGETDSGATTYTVSVKHIN